MSDKPATIGGVLAGPHIRSLADIGDAAPVVIIEPLRVVPFGHSIAAAADIPPGADRRGGGVSPPCPSPEDSAS